MSVIIENQDQFNREIWDKLSADTELAKLPFRIESNEFGQVVMSPLPAPSHGRRQFRVAKFLEEFMECGEVITECPVSTRKGVKGADVVWCSDELWEADGDRSCFMSAPPICVEVISPSNLDAEMDDKKSLYFEQGAEEVWFVSEEGAVSFFRSDSPGEKLSRSVICPQFPETI